MVTIFRHPTILAGICILWILGMASICSALGTGGTRGDYPKCQQECLSQLEKGMAKASDMLSKDQKRIFYEEQVEKTNLNYNRCITNCKELMPVK
jgi:hypothetical protein